MSEQKLKMYFKTMNRWTRNIGTKHENKLKVFVSRNDKVFCVLTRDNHKYVQLLITRDWSVTAFCTWQTYTVGNSFSSLSVIFLISLGDAKHFFHMILLFFGFHRGQLSSILIIIIIYQAQNCQNVFRSDTLY